MSAAEGAVIDSGSRLPRGMGASTETSIALTVTSADNGSGSIRGDCSAPASSEAISAMAPSRRKTQMFSVRCKSCFPMMSGNPTDLASWLFRTRLCA